VTDFATAGEADATGLAHRVGREVVVQHERIATLAFEGIDDLRVAGRAERHRADRLGLTAGEQRRTVSLGQYIDFAGDGTHGAVSRPSMRASPARMRLRTMFFSTFLK
jgi:hypothetical protein